MPAKSSSSVAASPSFLAETSSGPWEPVQGQLSRTLPSPRLHEPPWLFSMNTPETRYVAVGEAEVAYQVIGEGPLDLVYHHGLCQLDLQWDVAPEAAFNSRLAAFSRLI